MRGVNKVILIGNVGEDPKVTKFDNGGMVANISLATSESYKDKNNEVQTATEWHRLAVFGKLGEIAEKYVKKGSALYIEGKLKTRSWEDKDGVKKYTTEVIVRELNMLDSKGSNTENNAPDKQTKTAGPIDAPQPDSKDGDNLPF